MILSIILGACLLIASFVIYNLMRKLEATEDELDDLSLSTAEFIVDLEDCYKKMQIIDSKGAFEKDDETGTVFTGIKNIIIELEKYYTEEEVNES